MSPEVHTKAGFLSRTPQVPEEKRGQDKPLKITTKRKKPSFFQRLSRKSLGRSSNKASSTNTRKSRSLNSPEIVGSSTSSLKPVSVNPRRSRSRSRGGRSLFNCTGGQRSRSCTPERNATTSCRLPVQLPTELINQLQQEEQHFKQDERLSSHVSPKIPDYCRSDDNDDDDGDYSDDDDDDDVGDDDSGVGDGEDSASLDKFKCELALDSYIIHRTPVSSGCGTLTSSVFNPTLSDTEYSPTCVEPVNMDISRLKISPSASLQRDIGKRLASRTPDPERGLADVTNAKTSHVHDYVYNSKTYHPQSDRASTLSKIGHSGDKLSDTKEVHVNNKYNSLTRGKTACVQDDSSTDKTPSIFSLKRLSFRRKNKKKDTPKTDTTNTVDEKLKGDFSTTGNGNDYTNVIRNRSKTVMEQQFEQRRNDLQATPIRLRQRSKSEDRSSTGAALRERQGSVPPEIPNRVSISPFPAGFGGKSMKGRPLPPLPSENESDMASPSPRNSQICSPISTAFGTLPARRCSSEVQYPSPVSYTRRTKPPPQGTVTLVKTMRLDKIIKNKWISGLAVTKKNEYVIVDQKEAYLVDEEGNLKKTIGAKGASRLQEPIDVAVMNNGNLVFSDHAEQDVKIYNYKGQFVRRVCDQTLTNIAGVTTTENNEIIIAGTDKERVSVHSENDELLYTIQTDKDGKCLFEHPYTVAVNPLTGDIIVGDDTKQLVTALSSDGKRVLWRYCPSGGRDRHFFPSSISVDADGYVFIADLYNEKVYMLDSSGKFLKILLSRGDGLRGGPGAIAVDGRGHLLVADEERTVRVFKYGENGFAMFRRIQVVS